MQKIDLMPTNEVYSPTTAANLASPTTAAKSPSVFRCRGMTPFFLFISYVALLNLDGSLDAVVFPFPS